MLLAIVPVPNCIPPPLICAALVAELASINNGLLIDTSDITVLVP